jgi:hypothetical protein
VEWRGQETPTEMLEIVQGVFNRCNEETYALAPAFHLLLEVIEGYDINTKEFEEAIHIMLTLISKARNAIQKLTDRHWNISEELMRFEQSKFYFIHKKVLRYQAIFKVQQREMNILINKIIRKGRERPEMKELTQVEIFAELNEEEINPKSAQVFKMTIVSD